jgi:hypothetical protein
MHALQPAIATSQPLAISDAAKLVLELPKFSFDFILARNNIH